MPKILLDLNNEEFQGDWFALDREDEIASLATFKKIRRLEWAQLYRDKGLRWEKIDSFTSPAGDPCYSMRVSGKVRVVAYRTGNTLRFVSVHPDHDSVYK
jgi:hypothetical protein